MSDLAERCKWDVGDVVALGRKPQRAMTAAGATEAFFNPYHDRQGRFAPKQGRGGGTALVDQPGGAAAGPLPQSSDAELKSALDETFAWRTDPTTGESQYDTWGTNSLTARYGPDPDRRDWESYTAGDAMGINGGLRGLRPMTPAQQASVDGMDRVFAKHGHTLDKPITVRRDVSPEAFSATFAGLSPGSEFVDHGFASTAAVPKNTDISFGMSQKPVTTTIRLPAGARVLSGNRDESEMILPRGSRFRVHRITNDGVELELVAGAGASLALARREQMAMSKRAVTAAKYTWGPDDIEIVTTPKAMVAAGGPQPDLLELVDDPTMVEATERLQTMYAAARRIVAARLEAQVAAAGDGTVEITPEEWDLIVAEHAGDVFGDAALDGVVAAAIITRTLVSDRDLAELTARHQRSLSSYGPWVSQKVSTWVDEQVASGASTTEIVRRLGEDSPLSPDKAAFVAQTELTAGVNGGLVAGMKEAGIAAKRWVSRRDNRVRPDHIAADGQTVPLDQDFNVGGWPASAPGDPRLPIGERANCRCSVVDVDGMFVRRAVAATKGDLYRTASGFGIVGRSTMNKGALQAAVLSHLCMQGLAGGADCPQTLHRMNRVALLAHARAAGIQGRHAMSRDDLVTALNDALRGTDQFRATHGYAPAAEMVRFRKEVATARRLAPRTDELATAGPLPPVAVRREARQAVFTRHGGPERGYVPCAWCGLKVHPDPRNPGGFDALIPDPINAGAGFGVSNVLPACPGCFRARGEGGLRRAVFALEQAVGFINTAHDQRGRFAPKSGGAGQDAAIEKARTSAATATELLQEYETVNTGNNLSPHGRAVNEAVIQAGRDVDAAGFAGLSPAHQDVLTHHETRMRQVDDELRAGSGPQLELLQRRNTLLADHDEAQKAHAAQVDDVLRKVRPGFGTGTITVTSESQADIAPDVVALHAKNVQSASQRMPKEWADGAKVVVRVEPGTANGGYDHRGIMLTADAPKAVAHHETWHAIEDRRQTLRKSETAYIAASMASGDTPGRVVYGTGVRSSGGLMSPGKDNRDLFRTEYSARVFSSSISDMGSYELGSTAFEVGHQGWGSGAATHRQWYLGTLVSA